MSAGDGSLTVSWSAPDDEGSTIIGYDVWYLPQGGIGRYWVRGTSATNVTITGLTNGIVYDVYVLATNSVGSGPWSDAVAGTPKLVTAPSRPILTLLQNSGALTLKWYVEDDGGVPIVDYRLLYRTSGLPFESDLEGRVYHQREESEDCLLASQFEMSSNLSARPSSGRAIIQLDSGCPRRRDPVDLVYKTLEVIVEARNASGLRSSSRPQRLVVMPWTPPVGHPTIRWLTVQEYSWNHPSSWRARAVHVGFSVVDATSHYEVQWRIDGREDVHQDKVSSESLRVVHSKLYTASSIRINDIWREGRTLEFQVIAHNSLGKVESGWRQLNYELSKLNHELRSAQDRIAQDCPNIQRGEAVSPDMDGVVLTVFGNVAKWTSRTTRLSILLKAVRRASWTFTALKLIDKLDRCYANLGDFLSKLPLVDKIVEGYTNNPYVCVSNANGADIDEQLACYGVE